MRIPSYCTPVSVRVREQYLNVSINHYNFMQIHTFILYISEGKYAKKIPLK